MTITPDMIETVFAALRPETRTKMEAELDASLNDTTVEYSKTPLTRGELLDQIIAIDLILKLSKKVSKEYEEISQSQPAIHANIGR